MAREGHWIAYTAAEADALEELERVYRRMSEAGAALEAAGADCHLVNALDDAGGALVAAERVAVHARLCRIMPHLADVFAFAIFAEYGTTPEWLPDDGSPHLVMHPTSRHQHWRERHFNGKEGAA